MPKLAKWEKEELLMIYKKNRQVMRCAIVKELEEKANLLTRTLSFKIKKMQKETDEILDQNNLLNISENSRYGCPTSQLHSDLQKFDDKTDQGIRDIIYDKEVFKND